jgi:hypothetical protein
MITGLWDDEAVEMKHLGVRERLAAWRVASEPHLLLEGAECILASWS